MRRAIASRRSRFSIHARTETVFNGDWFKKMTFQQVIELNSRVTLQQMLAARGFPRARSRNSSRFTRTKFNTRIMQGWDSVMVKADVELGGTDQLFNILVGRDLQREQGLPQQVVLLLPILEGLDGVQENEQEPRQSHWP